MEAEIIQAGVDTEFELGKQCAKYVSARHTRFIHRLGIWGCGGAEVLLAAYIHVQIQTGKVTDVDFVAFVFGTLALLIAQSECSATICYARDKMETLLTDITKYRSEHATMETDLTMLQHRVPFS